MATDEKVTVKKGVQFRSTIADCNALWEVVSKDGKQGWLCVCVNEPYEINGTTYPSDYAGTEKLFSATEIIRHVKFEQAWANLGQRTNDWWANRTDGEVVHYHNSFGAYVRGVIVSDMDGNKKMRPTALIGDWRPYDLPRRFPDGSIIKGYHAEKIEKGELMQPNEGCMYESATFSPPRGPGKDFDPRTLDPIDITIPPMDTEAERVARAYAVINAVKGVFDLHDKDADDRLRDAAALIAKHLSA